jgi:hypothetical protein
MCFGKRKSSIKYNLPIIAYLPTMSNSRRTGDWAMHAIPGEHAG